MKSPNIHLVKENQEGFEAYEQFTRPLAADLMKGMKLDIEYLDGQGNWLEAIIDDKKREILDMTGGYGANLLGHKHPYILKQAIFHLQDAPPSNLQASIRKDAGFLCAKLSELLQNEVYEGPWITTLSNSGAESVEAALKHTLLSYGHRQKEKAFDQNRQLNESLIILKEINQVREQRIYLKLKRDLSIFSLRLKSSPDKKDWLLHNIVNAHSLKELVEIVYEYNQSLLEVSPQMVALEKSYHGKLMGSLSLTSSQKYREPFYLGQPQNVVFLQPTLDPEELKNFFDSNKLDLIELHFHYDEVILGFESFSQIAGLILEPIQGEAGIHPLPHAFLQLIKKFSLENSFLLIFDEIQAGMYRTGTLSSGSQAEVAADIYCFSKTLGGGIAKIGATCIHHRKYIKEFGLLHTSTFSEDGFSSRVALDVLTFLQSNSELIHQGMREGINLKYQLISLQEKYPDVIQAVRGTGLMLAIEFNSILKERCYEFKMLDESHTLGYLFASFLLHQGSIRTTPSLSNGLILRIQPSLYLNELERNWLMNGLERLCYYIHTDNLKELLSHIYPQELLKSNVKIEFKNPLFEKKKPLAVFLCHFIDGDHVKKVSPCIQDVPKELIEEQFKYLKGMAEFSLLHYQEMIDEKGQKIDVALMGLPITSYEMKKDYQSKNRVQLIEKIQKCVDHCRDIGATTIGLGQFTSIVTNNGLYLNSHGMNLTTGNSYTIALAIKAAVKAAYLKNIELENATSAIIGAAGNIMSVATGIMADQVKKVILIHHTEIEKSQKFLSAVKLILLDILNSKAESLCVKSVKAHFNYEIMMNDEELLKKLRSPEVSDFFEVTGSIEKMKDADIVLTGASTHQGFLTPDHFKLNSVIVDVAVPANIKEEVLLELRSNRPDVHYLLGGIAKLPREQSIDTEIFILNEGESYACMAETFILTFSGREDLLHIGNLSKSMVEAVNEMAEKSGFDLAGFKLKTSIL